MSATPIVRLYQSSELCVVAKPEGLASIPERDLARPSIRTLLEAEAGERLYVVHRLDKDVSGVLLFARTAAAHRELSTSFEQRRVAKSYLCAVAGAVARNAGTIDAPLYEFGSGRMGVDPRGKPSLTEYEVLARTAQHSLLEVRPLSGRRHQIRVHLYSLGHPILGDPRYGPPRTEAAGRLMLHAYRLSLPELSFSGPLSFQADPPESFRAELARLGFEWPLSLR